MAEQKRVEVLTKKPVDVLTDDAAIAAMLQADEERFGDYHEPAPAIQEQPRKILTQRDAPAVDFIAKNSQTLINSVNQHYWEELFSFAKLSDELEDDDVVRMISADKSGFRVSVAPRKVRGKTVHTLIRRIDFQDDVFTEKEFMDEFFEAVNDADREGDYDRVSKLSSDLMTTSQVKLGGGKDFSVRNEKKPRHPPKQRVKGRNGGENADIGPAEEMLMANKDAAKEIMYLKAALLSDFYMDAEKRPEQILKMTKHERLTVPTLCKKAAHKFRMKGVNPLIAIYDRNGQEVRSKTALTSLKTGDLLFFSAKRGQDKIIQEQAQQRQPHQPTVSSSSTATATDTDAKQPAASSEPASSTESTESKQPSPSSADAEAEADPDAEEAEEGDDDEEAEDEAVEESV